jgi:hypothetical protein
VTDMTYDGWVTSIYYENIAKSEVCERINKPYWDPSTNSINQRKGEVWKRKTDPGL